MDETNLFYNLQVDHHFLATKQLEGRKHDKEKLTIVICCNEDELKYSFMHHWKICEAKSL